ncbi:SET domain-containing protein [Trichoderma asperelloides]|nr:SET domain-containing protein [Trichoderma asperelloides]
MNEASLSREKREDNDLTRKMSSDPEFENDFFKVSKSKVAGWGAFATRDLAKGDVILRERPLFVATNNDLFQEFYNLGSDDMDIALSLHSHQFIKGDTPIILGIWHTNCFSVGCHTAGLFPIAARFNHACHPINNIDYRVNQANNLIMTARADIIAGQELTISYGKNLSPQLLYLCYGFRCRCGYCSGLGDDEIAMLSSHW